MMKKEMLTILFIVFVQVGFSQNYKFGKVSKQELEEKVYPLDSTANAAYLYKKRNTYTSISAGNDIQLITEVHVRLKIYSKDGFDWATVEQKLFGALSSNSEKLTGLKAYTYNLVADKIVKTKLEKADVFSDQKSKNWKIKKFAMPNLKEGSVVEWSYKLYSPYFTFIDDIDVQYLIPVKKYDTKIALIEWFSYNKRQKGYYPFNINEYPKRNVSLDTNDKVIEIIKENIPAIEIEPYVDNLSNYAAGLKLEVASLRIPESGVYEDYTNSWKEVAKDIYKNIAFGMELKKINHLNEGIEGLKNESTSVDQKIFNALMFVKGKIKWNGNYNKYTEKGLRKAYKEGVGNIADINLTLVAVLKELGINANPVLVSTRNNGVPLFPTKRGFNYVIAIAETSTGNVLLDATEKYSLPNVLPLRAINWNGVIVRDDESTDFVNLSTTVVSNEEVSLSYKILDDELIEGMNRIKYKNYASLRYRRNFGSLSEDEIISKVEEKKDIDILNFRISNLKDVRKPLTEMYKFENEEGIEVIGGKMYVSPLLFCATKENPFKIESRAYPIDFGSPYEKKVTVSLQVPEGYNIESLPENVAIGMSDELGVFIYSVKNQGNKIQVTSVIKINEGVIPSNYYLEIKDMFSQIVTKHTEKIVLSKS